MVTNDKNIDMYYIVTSFLLTLWYFTVLLLFAIIKPLTYR